MRRITLALAITPLLYACGDSTSPRTPCSDSIAYYTTQYGHPTSVGPTENLHNNNGEPYQEVVYTWPGHLVTFAWGQALGGTCGVDDLPQ